MKGSSSTIDLEKAHEGEVAVLDTVEVEGPEFDDPNMAESGVGLSGQFHAQALFVSLGAHFNPQRTTLHTRKFALPSPTRMTRASLRPPSVLGFLD